MKKEYKELPVSPLMLTNMDRLLNPFWDQLEHQDVRIFYSHMEQMFPKVRLPVGVADKFVARYKELLAQLQADREAAKMWDGQQLRLFKKENHNIIENL